MSPGPTPEANPFGISKKKQPDATAGRLATGAFFPGWHGAIAGKKGGKLKAAGTETGLAAAGTLVAPGLGTAFGGAFGAHIAHKQGWLKPQKVKKNMTGHAAFGIEDPIEKAFTMPKLQMPKMPGSFMGTGAKRATGPTNMNPMSPGGAHKAPGAVAGAVKKPKVQVAGAIAAGGGAAGLMTNKKKPGMR